MVARNESRIVLRRLKGARTLRVIGAIAYLVLVLLFIWAFTSEASDADTWIFFLVWMLVLLPGFRSLLRKIVLLENYISFSTWFGLPKVYAYDQIKNVETYVTNEDKWTWELETYVKVTFEDGRTLKVYKGLMSVREFRKFLRNKTGRTFRRSAKLN